MKLKISELKPNPFKKEINDGKTKEEIASEVLGKQYATIKELRMIYNCITILRKQSDYCLAYRNKKYGWAHDKDTIDNYRLNNFHNAMLKAKSNILCIQKNYNIEGITENPLISFKQEGLKFGFKLIELKKGEKNGVEDRFS